MALGSGEWALVHFLSLLNLIVLTVGFVLSVVAARGFSDAPFGKMLRPLPVLFAAFVLLNAPWVAGFDGWVGYVPWYSTVYQVVFTVAVVAAMWAAAQAVYLLTERRAL